MQNTPNGVSADNTNVIEEEKPKAAEQSEQLNFAESEIEPDDLMGIEGIDVLAYEDESRRNRKTGKFRSCKNWTWSFKVKDADEAQEAMDRFIKTAKSWKAIDDWACAYHDRDVYTQEDIDRDTARHEKDASVIVHAVGDPKDGHVHFAVNMSSANSRDRNPETIGKKFNIAQHEVCAVEARRGDKVRGVARMAEYYTHKSKVQQNKGKTLYPDSVVQASFDWQKEIDDATKKDEMVEIIEKRLLNNEITIEEVKRDYEDIYLQNDVKFERLFKNSKSPDAPPYCLNIYISGVGGCGKSALAELIVKSLYPDITDIKRRRLHVRNIKNPYQKYTGQKAVIWDEARAKTILYHNPRLNRGIFFDLIDPYQKGGDIDVKFGSVELAVELNIFTGPDISEQFLNELCGEGDDGDRHYEAENPEQAIRRFQLCVDMLTDHWDVWTCTGWDIKSQAAGCKPERKFLYRVNLKKNPDTGDYLTLGLLRTVFKNNDERFEAEALSMYVRPILDTINEIKAEAAVKLEEDDIISFLGKFKTPEEIIQSRVNMPIEEDDEDGEWRQETIDGFMNIPDGIDAELPFQ